MGHRVQNMNNQEKTMEKIVSLCKNRGIVYSGSEYIRGIGERLGLRSAGRGAEKQYQTRVVEKIRPGMSV